VEVMFSAKVHDVNAKVVDVGKDAVPTITVVLVNRGPECISDAQALLNLLGKRVVVSLVQEQGDLPFQQGLPDLSTTDAHEGDPD